MALLSLVRGPMQMILLLLLMVLLGCGLKIFSIHLLPHLAIAGRAISARILSQDNYGEYLMMETLIATGIDRSFFLFFFLSFDRIISSLRAICPNNVFQLPLGLSNPSIGTYDGSYWFTDGTTGATVGNCSNQKKKKKKIVPFFILFLGS